MVYTNSLCCIFISSFPNHLRNEIVYAKNLVANLAKIFNLIIINRYENNAIVRK